MPIPLTASSSSSSINEHIQDTQSLTLEEIKNLTDVNVIKLQLSILDKEETNIDQELETLLNRKNVLESNSKQLEALKPQLKNLQNEVHSLTTILDSSAKIAKSVCQNVIHLEIQQRNIESAIQRVKDIQDLKGCVTGVQESLKAKDYEAAAGFIFQYLKFDKSLIEATFSEHSTHSSARNSFSGEQVQQIQKSRNSIREVMSESIVQLKDIASKEFDEAVAQGSEERILRFFKLFPIFGEHLFGLEKYASYLRGVIAKACRDARNQCDANAPRIYGIMMTKLFENLAYMIDTTQPMIETHYGLGKVLYAIQQLQVEADVQSCILLDMFAERRDTARKVREIQMVNGKLSFTSAKQNQETYLDRRELDGILTEIAMISHRKQLFERFISSRAESELKILKEQKEGDWFINSINWDNYGENGLLKASRLSVRVQDLISEYIAMEEHFLLKSIDKAMKIDEHDEDSLTTTAVDDVFFVLKKVATRAVSTSNVEALCALINIITNTLETSYIDVFKKQLGFIISNIDSKESRLGYMIILNNIDISCDYIQKLSEHIQLEISSIFNSPLDKAHGKMELCLTFLKDQAGRFRQNILYSGVVQLFGVCIKQKLKGLLQESWQDSNYLLDEEKYAQYELGNNFTKIFISKFDTLIDQYVRKLTENNFSQLMGIILEYLAKEWERFIVMKKFTQLGALLFDKEVRAVTAYITNLTKWTPRDKLTRINQIAILLNMEKLEEIYDNWGDQASTQITWVINPNEMRKLLTLRVDFRPDDIARLKL